jgi:hypothetical protein
MAEKTLAPYDPERAAALAKVLHTLRAAELLIHAKETRDPADFAEAARYRQAHALGDDLVLSGADLAKIGRLE